MKIPFKNPIFTFILGALIFGTSGVLAATYLYKASEIEYTPEDNTWNVNNVENAINEIFNELKREVTIYSAANDTIYYYKNNERIDICQTNSSGNCTSELPVDEYTLYSSVAKDPDNLNYYYSKNVIVSKKTNEIYLMPVSGDNMIYWYGYKGNVENVTTSNGWNGSNYTLGEGPSWNDNNVNISYTSNKAYSFGTKKAINLTSGKSKMIWVIEPNNNTSTWLCGATTKQISGASYVGNCISSLNQGINKYSVTATKTGDAYSFSAISNSSANYYVYAFWIEE